MKDTTTIDSTNPCHGWAIAIHGGAGTIPRDAPPLRREAATRGLATALDHGRNLLQAGRPAVEVAEAVVRILEDDPTFNAGRGAVLNVQGEHELEASIMEGHTARAGAVAGLRTVRNPITLARHVMRDTPHLFLAGDGAEAFADEAEVERVEPPYFTTEHRQAALSRILEGHTASDDSPESPPTRGGSTVGCVVVDHEGNLASATSTGGMTAKREGRIGDTPLIGAGTWADARVAVSGTGTGEEFIRWGIAHDLAARVEYQNASLVAAATAVVDERLRPDDGGVISVDAGGGIAMAYNSLGMYRGAANANGVFQVSIWEEPELRD